VSVVGARPQFVKAAVVSAALAGCSEVEEVLIHTGQHYDLQLSDVFFRELGLRTPDRHLGVGPDTPGRQTARMLERVAAALEQERPDLVLVYGDTNTTLAAALAAAQAGRPLAHVEAGLRSFNRAMPEEINRVVADHAADLLFAPTRGAVENLAREGIAHERVWEVGDVMYDAFHRFVPGAEQRRATLERLGLVERSYLLATVHRAQNTDDPVRLKAIVEGLCAVATRLPVVLPLHPRTRSRLTAAGALEPLEAQLRVLEPLGYLDMLALELGARMVVTDSGGVQKEACFAGVPCVTLREETEWPELVKHGANRLVAPTSAEAVAWGIRAALRARPGRVDAGELYGAGRAGERIGEVIRGGAWRGQAEPRSRAAV
jgi:UDP-GlcNAc3NAcA epimerase